MSRALLILVLLAAVCAPGCSGGDDEDGGNGTTAQLTLDQRVANEADAPGSKADPAETPRKASSADEFQTTMTEHFIDASEEEKQHFAEGLVAALLDTRFYPDDPDGQHSPALPHLTSFVAEYDTEDAAQRAAEFMNEDGGRPCPENCADRAESFTVDGTPDALGIHRYATPEGIEEVGEPDKRPYDAFTIHFASGNFAYTVETRSFLGAQGAVSEEQVEEIAESLYNRVADS